MLKQNSTIVFQGDSITDFGRFADSRSLGEGYVAMCADTIAALCPSSGITVYNRGVSGNRIGDLVNRWEEDCIKLKPDYVSILIGINDVWRCFDSGATLDFEVFEQNFNSLLKVTKQSGAKIIVIEPFALWCGVVKADWLPMLNRLIDIQRKCATKHADYYIPANSIFAEKMLKVSAETFAGDGVHPTEAGHRLIAIEVLKKLEILI